MNYYALVAAISAALLVLPPHGLMDAVDAFIAVWFSILAVRSHALPGDKP